MKKSLFFTFIALLISKCLFAQINPIQNLLWEYEYLGLDGENFALSWDEPENPHDELLGYNIYRNNELYRFQVENVLFCTAEFDCNDDNGFPFFEGGQSFYAHVTAVYTGEIESEYIDSVYVDKPLLNIKEIKTKKIKTYPNPVQNELFFESEFKQVSIFSLNGNLLKSFKKVNSIQVADLPKGIYLIKAIKENDEPYETKFIKD